jgi:threonine synthase
MREAAFQRCISPSCGHALGVREFAFACPRCGELLDVVYDWSRLPRPRTLPEFDALRADFANPLNYSGVWRFRQLIPFAPESEILTCGEGQTQLRQGRNTAKHVGLRPDRLWLQYEGLNFSGSFKDNGMTGAFTHARMVNAQRAACASTGNTSASMAAFAAGTGLLEAIVFIGSGKIALGKLAQALDYGAKTIQIEGDFDDAMARVQEVCRETGIYLMNSLNPFRLEGQKAIMFRVLEGLRWQVPDWVVVPGGNLGNSSAFGKAFGELLELGLIERAPRIAIINAAGAPTLSELVNRHGLTWNGGHVDDATIKAYYDKMNADGVRAHTIASAIEINRPVNLKKALRSLEITKGVVRVATDEQILDAKAVVGRDGIGCEPASGASVAGAKLLREEGIIGPNDLVACVLTGHQLKDPNATVWYHSISAADSRAALEKYGVRSAKSANQPIGVGNDIGEIMKIIEG